MKKNKKKSNRKKQHRTPSNHPRGAGDQITELARAGVKAYHAGDLLKARELLENVIEENSAHVDALSYLGLIAHEQEQYSRALFLLQQAAYHDPKSPVHQNNLANVHASIGQLYKAAEYYRKALEYAPNHADLLFNLANIQKELGQLDKAFEKYIRTIGLDSRHIGARLALAELLISKGNHGEASDFVQTVLALDPTQKDARYLQAQLLLLQGNLEQAALILNSGGLEPNTPQQCAVYALQFLFLKDYQNLVSFVEKHLEQCVNYFEYALDKINSSSLQHMLADALVESLSNIHISTNIQNNFLEKLIKHNLYNHAYSFGTSLLEFYPYSESVLNNIGISLTKSGKYSEAIDSFKKALESDPTYTYALGNGALALYQSGNHDMAHDWYKKLLELSPKNNLGHSNFLMSLHYNIDFDKNYIFNEHLLWDRCHAQRLRQRNNKQINFGHSNFNIGLTSSSFKGHPVGHFILGTLQKISHDNGDLFLYSDTTGCDKITHEIRKTNIIWRETHSLTDAALSSLIQADDIDILIDLSGHSEGSRLLAFARKPAPIQVKWVGGQFNTTGMQAMDYFITDWVESPPGEEEWFTETLVRMPDGYVTFSPPDYAPKVGLLPALLNRNLTFGCFNNLAKVNEEVIRLWSKIMHRVPSSRLVLKSKQLNDPVIRDEFRAKFHDRGIHAQRLDLRPESPHNELLAQYNDIDIALDPFPYSGGLTTCEALWMGVPVLTKPGETFAGRHAASHVTNVGLKDWVVYSEEEYIASAVSWAKNLGALTKLRAGLREQVRNSPLCDHERFAKNFMDALHWMYEDTLRKQNENQQERLLEQAN